MTQTYTEEVVIDGSSDVTQLTVQGHSAQTEPLQIWEDSAGTDLAQVAEDGRLQIGDIGLSTDDALVEAHRDSGSSLPKRGLHSLGKISGTLSSVIAWAVAELELLGTGGVSALHQALRVKLTNQNSGDSPNADLRAGDFEAVNQGGSLQTPVGQATGIQATVSNDDSAYLADAVGVGVAINDGAGGAITNAYGVKVEDVDQGATSNYALHTGKGTVHLGDYLEMEVPGSVPGTPATDQMRIYPKSDGKLYAKNDNGDEFDLTAPPANASEDGLFYAYDGAGGLTVGTTTTVITLDTIGKLGDDFLFTAGGSEITIETDGWYEITYHIGTDVSSGSNRSKTMAQLEEDTGSGFAAVPGTQGPMYNRQSDRGFANASVTILRQYQSGDKIRLTAIKTGSDTVVTVANGVGITIREATRVGPKGDQGPQGPSGAAGVLPQGYIVGFECDCDGSYVTLQAGTCRSDDNSDDILKTTTITINPGTNGANGLDSGSLAADTWYYVFVIKGTSGVAGLMSASSSPTLPSGYDDVQRRVGMVKTEISGATLHAQRTERGSVNRRQVLYQEEIYRVDNGGHSDFEILSSVNIASNSQTAVDCSDVVPPTSREVIATVNTDQSSSGFELRWQENSVTGQELQVIQGMTNQRHTVIANSLPLDANQQGDLLGRNANENCYFWVVGYWDNLLPTVV